jgi:Ca2+-binding RTX toxin-like protein
MQTGGPVVTLDDESVSSPTFTAPSVSFDTTLNFSLTVKDDKDAMSTPTAVSITVKAAPAFTSTPPTTTSLANETNRETSAAAESDFMSTIEGTDEQDNLSGTDEADNIEGHGKDDVIHGQAGNDRIEGDPGNDRLYGDDGNDLIEGGDKDDLLDGGEGDDTLSGGDGDDSMTGGIGKDHFNCGDGNLDRILDYSEGEGDTKAVDCEVITPNISEEQTE